MRYGFKIWSAYARWKIRRLWLRLTGRRFPLPLMQEIKIPTFKIVENPVIRISEIKARRFYIVDRAQIQAKHSISPDGDPRYQARPLSTKIPNEDLELLRSVESASHGV